MKNFMVFDIGGSAIKWSVIKEKGDFVESGKFNVPEHENEFFNELSKVTKVYV